MKNAVFLKKITMIKYACSFSFYNSSKNKKLIKRLAIIHSFASLTLSDDGVSFLELTV